MRSLNDIDLTARRVLIVDDQEANVRLIELILESAGFHQFAHTTDARQAVALCKSFEPDIILLDLQMPHQDGFAVMAQLGHELPPQSYLPILVLTADITSDAKQRALASGANDFLAKPLDPVEVILRIKNLLHTRTLYQELQQPTLPSKPRCASARSGSQKRN
jgi:putative two-component system response regulator